MERRIRWLLSTSVLVGLAVALPALADLDGLDEAMIAASHELISGVELTGEHAVALERRVAENPWDLESRTRLIGHYSTRLVDVEARLAHRGHVLWLIEHQPEAPVLALAPIRMDPVFDGRLYRRGAEIWNGHLERNPDNLAILHNASAYFRFADRELSIELLERASQIEPGNPRWRERIGQTLILDALAGSEPDVESAAEAVAAFESALAEADDTRRLHLLADAAEAAALAEEWEKAVEYATDLLRSAAGDTTDWFYGNAVHRGNLVLGRVAFAKGDIDQAERFLVRAGHTPGSPQLNSFGPGMRLARDLLETGRREAVIEYLELCGRFWRKETVDEWVQTIEAGEIPSFGPNLR